MKTPEPASLREGRAEESTRAETVETAKIESPVKPEDFEITANRTTIIIISLQGCHPGWTTAISSTRGGASIILGYAETDCVSLALWLSRAVGGSDLIFLAVS
ncbi:hypothetical protein EJ08DRAFT_168628 [Tothia fuscella]|uniref:Uncharacterized protein n=1 Tax=Tothia fuscella TaxID=1048955 RepID=A0A9P4U0H6_9PEZI|nr:hypothetical protein EJ08DRAFT_168628 [Tothia fuscella]